MILVVQYPRVFQAYLTQPLPFLFCQFNTLFFAKFTKLYVQNTYLPIRHAKINSETGLLKFYECSETL